MLTKFASFEVSEVLEIKGSPTRRHTASLDKLADFENYRTSDGYMYVRIRAISSRVNKNHDGWPSVELAGSPEIFERHAKQSSSGFTVEAADGNKEFGFATFIGKPIFVDHNNSDPKRARGVIVDAKLNVSPHDKESSLDPYYSSDSLDPEHLPPTEVELLLEVDAKSFPKFAKAIRSGDLDGFSMGCDVERSKCSHCGHEATNPDEYCSHILMKGANHDYKTAEGKRISRKSYENCYGIHFFEISGVFDPADETALTKEIRAGLVREAAGLLPMPPTGYMSCPACDSKDPNCPVCRGSHLGIEVPNAGDDGPEEPNAIGPGQMTNPWQNGRPQTGLAQPYIEDETHQLGPVRQGSVHESVLENALGLGGAPDPLRTGPHEQAIKERALELVRGKGLDYPTALEMAQTTAGDPGSAVPGEGSSPEVKRWDYNATPGQIPAPKSQNPEDEFPGAIPNQPVGPLHGIAEEMFEEKYPGGAGRPVRNDPRTGMRWSKIRTAENPLPQSFHTTAPEEIDTLRQEHVCPVCGETMEGETCDVCGYVEPPKGFDNPDLEKAQQIQQDMQEGGNVTIQQDNAMAAGEQGQPQGPDEPKQPGSLLQQKTRNPQPTASVMSDMRWQPKLNPRLAGRINQSEKPLSTSGQPATNEPTTETVTSNPQKPVTSAMKTAQDMIEAARTHRGDTMSTKTADGPTAPEAAPDKRVDVEGVGGVIEDSNDSASAADAQVDVTGVGGTGVEGVEADKTESLPTAAEGSNDAGFNKEKNIEAIPSKTFGDSDGTEKGVSDSVTTESLEGNQNKGSSFQIEGYDSKPYYDQEGLSGGSANQGTQPADPVGKAEDRVDVLKATTTPSNNSGKTDTWSGTDGNGVTRQQEPVTKDLQPNNTDNAWTSHLVAAMKLADEEVKLGLLPEDEKYERIAQLEAESDEQIVAQHSILARVKTAGLAKLAQQRSSGVTRLPTQFGRRTAAPAPGADGQSFERVNVGDAEPEPEDLTEDVLDSALYG